MAQVVPRKIIGWSQVSRGNLAIFGFLTGALLTYGSLQTESGRPPDLQLVVDPNEARAGVLMTLPRLGPALVGRIKAQREIRPFESLDDLDNRVKGIGPATMRSIRPFLRVKASTESPSTTSRFKE